MRNKNRIFLLCFLISCTTSNRELVLEYKNAEITGSSIEELLSEDVTGHFSDTDQIVQRSDIILNHEFNSEYNPWHKVISIKELNETVVELVVLETNELLQIFSIDTLSYLYRYTISDERIAKIYMDTVPDAGYDYRLIDSLYQAKLSDLFEWIKSNAPEEYEKIAPMNSESASIILSMARMKYGR